jgi:hypothetical protein
MMFIYYPKKEAGVIDASGRFAQKQHHHEFRWVPTLEIEEALKCAIFNIKNDEGPKQVKKSSLRLV